jgi:asparagine synthase (glutamine-hydrolysing)
VSDGAPAIDRDEVLRVREAMASRGPDGAGAWFSSDGTVGLGHRRLAILDLSEAALQPMASASGRYRIVFNGEVYNFLELRERLEAAGTRFRTRSDTEVILALYEAEGPAGFARLRGMFALAIWDGLEGSLVLARDPYGIKPLYHACTGGTFRFASQVKALEKGGGVSREIEPAAVVGFLLWGSVPEPWTIRTGVRALPPGHWLRAGRAGVGEPVPFGPLARGRPEPPANDAVGALERSVRYHLVSDVPVAVFLSAGLDSAMIAALARRASPEPPTTITLRFEEFRGTTSDEAPTAARIAAALGTRHVERTVGRGDFLGLWDRAVEAMDQPSIDGFNTYVVSRVAADLGFKVALSGLGGDELFGSYASFRDVPRWARWSGRLGRIPGLRPAWPLLSRLFPTKPKLAAMLDTGASLPGAYALRRGLFLPAEVEALLPREWAREGLRALEAASPLEASLRSQGVAVDALDADPWRAVHWMESVQYMKNQLLRDSDWASMAHSLELRVPFVDAFLRVEIEALGFEPARSRGKAAVARSVAPELPAEVFLRPKTGFGIPVMGWLDPETKAGDSLGADSRRLAIRVLEPFGIETRSSPRWSAKR